MKIATSSALTSFALGLLLSVGSSTALADGACCYPDGTCHVVTPSVCHQNEGIWKGYASCQGVSCTKFRVSTFSGLPVAIPDSPAPAMAGPPAYVDLSVAAGGTVTFVGVSLFIDHPVQGDLRVGLTHLETGTTVILVDRPGFPASPLGFQAPNLGAASMDEFEIVDDPNDPQYNAPAVPFPGIPNVDGWWRSATPLATFSGEAQAGTWRLWVTDNNPGGMGALISAQLKLGPDNAPCYANCDGSVVPPILNVGDFTCFLQRFAAGDPWANCDGSVQPPVLNVGDFTCFLQKYAAGCSAP
jgi:subtilisin-like proprotein convertase family protein